MSPGSTNLSPCPSPPIGNAPPTKGNQLGRYPGFKSPQQSLLVLVLSGPHHSFGPGGVDECRDHGLKVVGDERAALDESRSLKLEHDYPQTGRSLRATSGLLLQSNVGVFQCEFFLPVTLVRRAASSILASLQSTEILGGPGVLPSRLMIAESVIMTTVALRISPLNLACHNQDTQRAMVSVDSTG